MTVSDEQLAAMSVADLRDLSNRARDALRAAENKALADHALERFDYDYVLPQLQQQIVQLRERYVEMEAYIADRSTEENIAKVLAIAGKNGLTRERYLYNIARDKRDFEERGCYIHAGLIEQRAVMSSYPDYDVDTLKAHPGFREVTLRLSAALGVEVTFADMPQGGNVEYYAAEFYAKVPLEMLEPVSTPA